MWLRRSPSPRRADGGGAGYEANTQEAWGGVQGESGAGGDQGGSNGRRAGGHIWGCPQPDLRLEEAAAGRSGGRFEGGGTEDTASAAQVDLLYRQIGQLKVENDLYEGLAVKQVKFFCSAEGGFSVPAGGTRCTTRRSGQDWPKATAVVLIVSSTGAIMSGSGRLPLIGEVDPLRCGRAPGA